MAGRSPRATELLGVLKEFWAYLGSSADNLAAGQDPLFFLAREWLVWRDATPELREELFDLISSFSNGEQADFIELLGWWGREQFGYLGEGTTSMILHELCRLEEFQGWEKLEPYGRSALKGTYTVTLDIDPSVSPSIRPVAVLLTRRPEQGKSGFRPHLCEFDSKPGSVWHALTSLLGGVAFWPFAATFLLAIPVWSYAHWLIALLAFPGLAAIAALLSGPLVPQWDSGFLWLVVGSALAVLSACVGSMSWELGRARRQRSRLHGTTAAVLLGDADPERYLRVHGASYGVALYLSTLRVLYAATRDRSWLARSLERLTDSSVLAVYSGGVRGAGVIRDVDSVLKKIRACRRDARVRIFLVRPGRQHGFACGHGGLAGLVRVCRSRLRARRRARRRARKLRVAALPRVASLLLIANGHLGLRHWGASVVSTTVLATLVAGAVNAGLLLFQPRPPTINFRMSGIRRTHHGKSDELKIAFNNVRARPLYVWFTSDFWVNRAAEVLVDSGGDGEISVPLERHPRSTTTDPYSTDIDIAYDRSFFLRPLAPVIVKRFSLRSLVADSVDSAPVE
jgi:hypothetical protein